MVVFLALYYWHIIQKEFKQLSDTIVKPLSFTSTYVTEQSLKRQAKNGSQTRTAFGKELLASRNSITMKKTS